MPIVSGGGGGAAFNGGTITEGLAIADPDPAEVQLQVTGAVAQANDILDILTASGQGVNVLSGGGLNISPDAGNTALFVSANGVDVVSFNSSLGIPGTRWDLNGTLIVCANAAPADGVLAPGDCALWFDKTNGVGNTKLMVKAKSADGTVKTASIVLA